MKTPHIESIGRSPLRLGLLLVPLGMALAWIALSPQARAVCQQGCLTNENTVLGDDAFSSNTTGFSNTAAGFQALKSNTTGTYNTATGDNALLNNTTGLENTATGIYALVNNTIGNHNTATGADALIANNGSENTANGYGALYGNTTGAGNVADGREALFSNTTGSGNIALGDRAGFNLTTGDNNIDIGNPGVAGESNTIRIGNPTRQTNTFIAGVSGSVVGGSSVPVRVNASGRLGTAPSSERFKQDIKPMDSASEAILALKPVTFRYKKEIDADRTPQFGLVAEQVEKVNPDLIARDEQGKLYTVRYDAVNVMLLNEFLKEHKAFLEQQRKVQEQGATIAELKSALAQQQKDFQVTAAHQQKQIEAVTAGLQKVSAQLELNKTAPQTVLNNH